MKRDVKKTRVKFVQHRGDTVALFPDLPYDNLSRLIDSYSHVGQHSGASKALLNCKASTYEEFKSLKGELTARGYNLEVIYNWKKHKNLCSQTLYATNGLPFGAGRLEVIIKKFRGMKGPVSYSLEVTDGYTVKLLRYFNLLKDAKAYAEENNLLKF